MNDYLLISTGKKGTLTYEKSSLEECVKASEIELSAGQECTVYVRHSNLKFGGVVIEKSEIQLKAEEATAIAEQALPVSEVKP